MGTIVTLDFETFYRSAKNVGTTGPKMSLNRGFMTYEQYIRDPEFKVHGVGIKINGEKTVYYPEADVKSALHELFTPDNDITLIAQNTMFDGAILSWYYGLRAARYWDTQGMSKAIWAQCSASLGEMAARLFPDDPTMRKGKELSTVDGLKDLTPAQQQVLGGYCVNDVDLTFACFAAMYPYFPDDELDVIDLTLKMFIHPAFVLHRETVERYQAKLVQQRRELVKASGVPAAVLSSNQQFAEYLEEKHGIVIPMKPSPTAKNPANTTLALAKDDLEYLAIQAKHPELKHIWAARTAIKSTGELTRCARLLDHAKVSHINPHGLIAAPLGYCAAHTKRFGGTNKVNFQNFKRNSPLRHALYAPEGYKVLVRDLSNIEGRMNAWFHDQDDKLVKYANDVDIYNELASTIYGYPVDRKALRKNAGGQYLDKNDAVTNKDDAEKVFDVEGRVGKVAELGLGYQMGATTFLRQLYLAGVDDADEAFAKKTVATWRAINNQIVKGWKRCEQVIFDMARKDLEPYRWKCITVEKERLRLPNGLYLTYPGLVQKDDGRDQWMEYWEGDFMKSLYGGLLDENCLAAGTQVLTDSGWKNIEDVSLSNRVHDGDNWVTHDGLISKGNQLCIDYFGVLLTPDHEVLDETSTWAAASQNPKPYRPNIRVVDNNRPSGERREETPLVSNLQVRRSEDCHRTGISEVTKERAYTELRVPNKNVTETPENPRYVEDTDLRRVQGDDRPLQTPDAPSVEQLRSAGDHCMRALGLVRELLCGYGAVLRTWVNARPGKQRAGVFAGELPLGNHARANSEQAHLNKNSRHPGVSQTNGDKPVNLILPAYAQPVFDIRNAGPQHRFVINSAIGPIIVHNCIQAISRVVMTTMMLAISRRITQYDARVVLTVHDEIIVICPDAHVDIVDQIMAEEMSRCPDWCNDGKLVLTSEGGCAQNYSK